MWIWLGLESSSLSTMNPLGSLALVCSRQSWYIKSAHHVINYINKKKRVHQKKSQDYYYLNMHKPGNLFFYICSIVFGKQKEERIQGYLPTIHTGNLQNKIVAEQKARRLIWALCELPAMLSYLCILDICANRKGKLYLRSIEYNFMKLAP